MRRCASRLSRYANRIRNAPEVKPSTRPTSSRERAGQHRPRRSINIKRQLDASSPFQHTERIFREVVVFEFLQPVDGPVIEGREAEEVVFAAEQPQYNPLRALPLKIDLCGQPVTSVWSRWRLTPEQREAIALGETDIYLEMVTFRRPLQPVRMGVGTRDEAAEALAELEIR